MTISDERLAYRKEGVELGLKVRDLIRELDGCFGIHGAGQLDIEQLAKVYPRLRAVREQMDDWFARGQHRRKNSRKVRVKR